MTADTLQALTHLPHSSDVFETLAVSEHTYCTQNCTHAHIILELQLHSHSYPNSFTYENTLAHMHTLILPLSNGMILTFTG